MRFPDSGRFRGIAFITFATVRCSASSAALLMFVQAASLCFKWGCHVPAACESSSFASGGAVVTLMSIDHAALLSAQKEGYEAALACDGEVLEQTRVKVEPCKTPRTAPRAAPNAAPAQHKGAAPKARCLARGPHCVGWHRLTCGTAALTGSLKPSGVHGIALWRAHQALSQRVACLSMHWWSASVQRVCLLPSPGMLHVVHTRRRALHLMSEGTMGASHVAQHS